MMSHRRAAHLTASAFGIAMLLLVGSACSDPGDKDTEALFAHVNELRAERGAEPWSSPDDAYFQAYLQTTKDDCASNFSRESTYERYYLEEGEEFAEDYRDRLAVLCPEEAATLQPPTDAPPATTIPGTVTIPAPDATDATTP